MSKLQLLLVLFASSVLWPRAHSQGPGDCIFNATLTMSNQIVFAPPGTVCFQCEFGGIVATDSTFQIDNGDVPGVEGRTTMMGVLVIFDSEQVFGTASARTVRCDSVSGRSSRSALTFLEMLQPPVITGDTTVNEGGNLTLDCDSSNSQPPPTVAWFSPEGEMLTILRELEVVNIRRGQAGEYRCVATVNGDSSNSTVDVTVQHPPDVFANLSDTIEFPLGGTLQLICTYEGIPPPNMVSWRNNETDLLESDPDVTITFDTTSTTLTRTNLPADGGGFYTCIATNVAGQGTAFTRVRVQFPPGPPTGLRVAERTNQSLFIRWENPDFDGFSPIASFRVHTRNDRTTDTNDMTFSGSVSTTEYNITDLSPFTGYTIDLYVRNAVDLEGESGRVREATVSLTPTSPQDFTVTAVDPFTLGLSWSAPADSGGRPIDEYLIEYRQSGVGASFTTTVLGAGARGHSIEGLTQDTTYEVAITVSNTRGLDSPRVIRQQATPAVGPAQTPDTPTVSDVTNTTADVSWTAAGGFPNFYIFQFKRRADDWSNQTTTTTRNLSSSVLTQPLIDLEPLTSYDARVRSQNINGLSAFSSEATFSTVGEITIQGPPQNESQPADSSVTLKCSLEGAEEGVEYVWTRSGGSLPPGSQASGDTLILVGVQQEDSGVYVCTAQGVSGSHTVMIAPSTSPPDGPGNGGNSTDDGISTTVIIIAASLGGGALLIFLLVVLLVVCILCCSRNRGSKHKQRQRPPSFRSRHWTDSSTTSTGPRAKDSRREEHVQSFRLPNDYQRHTSFTTADRHAVQRSPSPPSYNGIHGNTLL